MKFIQTNSHKAQLASIERNNELERSAAVALVTEPYTFRKQLVGVPAGYRTFRGSDGVDGPATRTAIMVQIGTIAVQWTNYATEIAQ